MARRAGKMRVFSPFPLFHMAGIAYCLPIVTFIDSTTVLGTTAPLSVNLVHDVHKYGAIDFTSLPPSVLTELCKRDTFVEKAKKLRGLTYAGGPLGQATGDMLCRHVPLYSDYGSTEMGVPPLLSPNPEYWQYFKFNIEQGGFEFRPAENDLYELVIVRKQELDLLQANFVTFPDLREYHTKDLFESHPTEPHLWKYASRRDDIIVYNSGEKMNPVTMEGTISACPEVTGCVVVGAGRAESALLVEGKTPPATVEEQVALLEKIWPHVQRANDSAVGHGKVAKDRIIFTTAEKPLARADKGTVQRPGSLALYQQEIDELYNTTRETHQAVRCDNVGLDEVQAETDFFRAGMDSIQTIELTRNINASSGVAAIEPKQIYDNPTPEQLANAIELAQQGQVYEEDSDDDVHLETWTQMQQMYYDITANYPKPTTSASRKHPGVFDSVRPLRLLGMHANRKPLRWSQNSRSSDETDDTYQARKDHGNQQPEP